MANKNIDTTNKSYVKYINPKHAVPREIRFLRLNFNILSTISTRLATKLALKLFYRPRRSPYSQEELEKLNDGESFTYQYKDYHLKVTTWGEGKPVLFMHGWDGKGIQIIKFIDPLVKMGLKVIIIDAPGHGQSSGKNVDITNFMESILLIQENFGPLYGIIAHSFGGLATILSLLQNKLAIEKIVLISSPASVDTVMDSFKAIFKLKDNIIENIKINANKRTGLSMWKSPTNDELNTIQQPILLIHDTTDSIMPFMDVVKLGNSLQNTKFMKTTGLGHRRILKDPQVISNVLGFLN
ncbi:MAG: alpha/beta hydrolase [Candidatus Thorarchaeota archaeon]